MRKGQTNNPNGRPVGAKNHTTIETKQFIHNFLRSKQQSLEEDWDKLSPFEKYQVYTKLLPFVTPKMRSVDATINFARLDPQTIDEIVAGLAKQQTAATPQLGAGEAEDTDESDAD